MHHEHKDDNSFENLKSLANTLTDNYIHSSIGAVEKGDDDSQAPTKKLPDISDLLNNYVLKDTETEKGSKSNKTKWRRIILIVGAGATYNAFNNIPLGQEAIDIIHNKIKLTNDLTFADLISNNKLMEGKYKNLSGLHALRKKYLRELNRLRLYDENRFGSNNEPDFETSLILLSHFFPIAAIRDYIHDIYSRRYGPTLYYDIMSHLLKHRFVDIIINFNFDELLDQAIEDEIGKDNFISILSDGDCKEIGEFLIDKKLKQPIYIKPHGTYSHKSTLRFTKNDYDLMPVAMKNFLEEVITCKEEAGHAKSSVLIVAGFALASVEFDDILKKVTQHTIIYYLEYSNNNGSTDKIRDKFSKSVDGKESLIEIKVINLKTISEGLSGQCEYDVLFTKLWEEITEKFNKNYYIPRGIERHKIVQLLFGCKEVYQKLNLGIPEDKKSVCHNKGYFHSKRYFRDRTIIETWIEGSKKQGPISIRYLLKTKAGLYFSKYHRAKLAIREKKPDGPWPLSFLELLKKIGCAYDYLTDECKMPTGNLSNLKKMLSAEIREQLEIHNTKIDKLLLDSSSVKSVIRVNYENTSFMALEKFNPSQILHTRLAYFFELVKRASKKWSYIFVVEDSGSFLNDFKNILDKEQTIITINTIDLSDELEIFNRAVKLRLSAHEHNHHMVLFVEDTDRMEAIYYYQKGLSNAISPIVIKEPSNLKLIKRIAKGYIEKNEKANLTQAEQSVLDTFKARILKPDDK